MKVTLWTLGALLAPGLAHPRLLASVRDGDLAAVSAALDAGDDVNEASREPFSVGRGGEITGVTPLMGAALDTDSERRDILVAKLLGAGAGRLTGRPSRRWCQRRGNNEK